MQQSIAWPHRPTHMGPEPFQIRPSSSIYDMLVLHLLFNRRYRVNKTHCWPYLKKNCLTRKQKPFLLQLWPSRADTAAQWKRAIGSERGGWRVHRARTQKLPLSLWAHPWTWRERTEQTQRTLALTNLFSLTTLNTHCMLMSLFIPAGGSLPQSPDFHTDLWGQRTHKQ